MTDIELLISIYKQAAMQGYYHPEIDPDDRINKRIGDMIRAGLALEEKIKNKGVKE